MVKLEIVKMRTTTKLFKWISLIGFALTISFIILQDFFSEIPSQLYLFVFAPTFTAMASLKFMNKSKKIGSLTFKDKEIVTKINQKFKSFDYNSIKKIRFNNYEGQQYFSIRDIYPFNDGLDNYIHIIDGNKLDKIEVKISNKKKYQELQQHIKLFQKETTDSDWTIKIL